MSDIICTVPIPGPQGPAGANGTNGTNGVSAFTTTTAGFIMPAEGANVTISVVTSAPFDAGQIIYVEVGGAKGYFEVVSAPTATSLVITNLENTASSLYLINSPPATSFASGASVQPGGLQGPAGTAGVSGAPTDATYIVQTAHAGLSAEQVLASLATGLVRNTTGTGVLSIATDGTHYLSPSTGLEPTDIGATVQAFDATLTSLATLGTAADRFAYTTGIDTWVEGAITAAGRALIDDANAAAQRNTLEVLPGYGLLASATAVDLNTATTDIAVTVNATRYLIDKITLENPSAALTLATMGIFTAAGGGGVTLAADQALAATLTATTKIMHLAKQAIVDTDSRTNGTLYVRVGTADGAATTVNVKIYGWKYA